MNLLYINYPSWLKPEIFPGLPIRWYGLMYIFAFGICYGLFRYQVRRRKLAITSDDTLTMFLWVMISALLVARIFATTIYDSTGKFLRQPWLIFWPLDGQGHFVGFQGMSYFGGLIGAVLGAILWSLKYKQDVLEWGDMIVHGFPLGYTFGRLGNFINGELYGRITASPLGMLFPQARRVRVGDPLAKHVIDELGIHVPADQLSINLPRHASQLYEASAEGLLLGLIMWFIVRPNRPYKGFSIGIYVFFYALFRFIIEYFRELDPGFGTYTAFNLSLGQLFCLIAMLASAIWLIVLKIRHDKRPLIETFSGE